MQASEKIFTRDAVERFVSTMVIVGLSVGVPLAIDWVTGLEYSPWWSVVLLPVLQGAKIAIAQHVGDPETAGFVQRVNEIDPYVGVLPPAEGTDHGLEAVVDYDATLDYDDEDGEFDA